MEQIEISIISGLMYNEDYSRTVFPYLKPEYFEGSSRVVFNTYNDLFNKYNRIPSMESMVVSIQKSKLDESEYASVISVLETVVKNKDVRPETDWLIDETESYCKERAMYQAIYQSISIIEGEDKNFDVNAIPSILDDALSVGFNTTVGSDYFENLQKRFEYYTSEDTRLPFPIKALNILSNTGLPKKTLNVILAGTNVGKSAMMCYLAGEWLKAGKNVLYITLEMSEEAIQERVDANLLDLTTDELRNITDFAQFEKKVKNIALRTSGRFIVKEFPTGGAHVGHIRLLLKELAQKKKFKPDIILVDYINIMTSSRYKSMSGVNSYSYIKAIAEELRGVGVEYDVPVLSATQTNREGYGNGSPDMTSVADSFGLSMTVDWMIALITNEELMAMNCVLGLLLKTRYGNKTKATNQMIKVDYDHMRYSDMEFDAPQQPTKPTVKPAQQSTESKTKNLIDWND